MPHRIPRTVRALCALVVLVLLVLAVAPAPAQAREGIVSDAADSALNLRTGPGTQFSVIGRMPNGSFVTFLEISGDWARVRHDSGHEGWAWYPYLIRYVGEDRPVFTAGPGGRVSLHSGPGTRHRVLRSVTNGTRMLAGESRGDWTFLQDMSGRPRGWASNAHLSQHMPPAAGSSQLQTEPGAPDRLYVNDPRDGWLNMRSGPGSNYAIIDRWVNGSAVDLLEIRGNWAHVIAPDGRRGWMYRPYLRR